MDSDRTQTFDGLTPIIDRFEQSWQQGEQPKIASFLPPISDGNGADSAPARRELLLELVLVDFEYKWKLADQLDTVSRVQDDSAGVTPTAVIPRRPRVEHYQRAFPELGPPESPPVEMVVQEYRVRHRWGDRPSHEEYEGRFPSLGGKLRPLLSKYDGVPQAVLPPASDPPDSSETAPHPHETMLPQIGRFRLVRLLGEGAFGRVWLGYDEELRRQVAIKVPRPERFKKPEDAEAYLAEARTVAGLDHPHIMPVYDVGRSADGSVYVVSKFIEGDNLEQRIKQDRPTCAAAAALLATVATALHHAHEKRLIHRDIKPANILIEDRTGTPYVADFGLAISEDDYLRDGTMAGTPAYMSPEQARGEGHRLDLNQAYSEL